MRLMWISDNTVYYTTLCRPESMNNKNDSNQQQIPHPVSSPPTENAPSSSKSKNIINNNESLSVSSTNANNVLKPVKAVATETSNEQLQPNTPSPVTESPKSHAQSTPSSKSNVSNDENRNIAQQTEEIQNSSQCSSFKYEQQSGRG